MSTLTVQTITSTGLAITTSTAGSTGDSFSNVFADIFLLVANGGSSNCVVTVVPGTTSLTLKGYGSIPLPSLQTTVPAGENRMIGTFGRSKYNDTSNNINISYNLPGSVTVAAIRLIST